MREKLKKCLRNACNAVTDASLEAIGQDKEMSLADWEEIMVTSLLEDGVTVPGWVSVMDRLPELHLDDYEEPDGSRMQFEASDLQWVFTSSGYQTKANYETSPIFQGWVDELGSTVRGVTHWMPLSEPPKGVNT